MVDIMVFYDFLHFVGKMDFVANSHPYTNNMREINIDKYVQTRTTQITRPD
ncbi:hypothetical protein Hanom_Chr11g00973101 [Helianthus anomalus]